MTEAQRSGGGLGADFPVRAASGLVMMAAALGFAWIGGLGFLVFWLAVSVGVLFEWRRLVGGVAFGPGFWAGGVALLVAAILAMWGEWPLPEFALLAVALGALASAALMGAKHRLSAGAGVFYAGVLAAGATALRASPQYGLVSILWLFGVVWGTDVMAYVGGRLIGGPKLWPRISPGKTWSGAIVGVVLGAVIGALVAKVFAPRPFDLTMILGLGLVAGAAAQAGDLFESALKRRAGVKDSSHLIPGHGGLMDRLDGFIAATAVSIAFACLRREGPWIASGLFGN